MDEHGLGSDRGVKVDNKYAYGYTEYKTHELNRGGDDFQIGPGQTFCVISSAVEGQTNVTVYAPGIHDWEKNKVHVKLVWCDARWKFPPAATARSGTEHVFATRVLKHSDGKPADGYRVRYTFLDGPPVGVRAAGGKPADVRELTVPLDPDGSARVGLAQLAAEPGVNRVGVEILKPDPDGTGFVLVSRGETQVDWQAPKLAVAVDVPAAVPFDADVSVTYAVSSAGSVEATATTLRARVPDGWNLVRTEPKAARDGDTLLWSIPPIPAGRQQAVRAVYRPTKLGRATASVAASSIDGLSAKASSEVSVTQAKLGLRLAGPAAGVVGEALSFEVVVTNPGDGPAENVRVKLALDDGLEAEGGGTEANVPRLNAGESKELKINLIAKRGGRLGVRAGAAGDAGLSATPMAATVDVPRPCSRWPWPGRRGPTPGRTRRSR